ncbi:uncharacterized protein LOC123292046 [Chrysoperla carnea]|uniref:uncharacterized protein LOC123292046 n=1 Tax=Chrysoperla carnea TaxID=189513 RepID=UPI001D069C2E|nr:uncharacterized protein LOC123292046 [Chrysoperla carnea]
MFEELIVQIQHQYGKYLNFDNAYRDSKDGVFGMKNGFYEDETIVRFIPKGNGRYQIQHQYGKYLNFDEAKRNCKERVYGMKKGFYEDETIVYLISKGDGKYQIKHQYGKYLNFDNAYSDSKEKVYGMQEGFYEDETLVRFLPIKYNFFIKIEDYQYDTTRLHDAESNHQIQNVSLISKTFKNDSSSSQKFIINESKTYKNSTTFEHLTTDVTRWLNEVSVGVEIKTEDIVPLSTTSFGYKYTWGTESIKHFNRSTTESVEKTINVTDEITVRPNSKMNYKYYKSHLSGIAIPFRAVMKIKCEMGGNCVSKEALKFILDHIGDYPTGRFVTQNGCGTYATQLTGKITPDIALCFSSDCKELPL